MITQTTKRFISLILVLCLVMSMLVFPVSATTDVNATSTTVYDETVFVYDSFDDQTNGYKAMPKDGSSVSYDLNPYLESCNTLVVKFDIMVSSTTDLGNLVTATYGTNTQNLLAINKGNSNAVLSPLDTVGFTTGCNSGSDNYPLENGIFKTVALVYTNSMGTVAAYYGSQGGALSSMTSTGVSAKPGTITFNCSSSGAYNIDNVLIYTTATATAEEAAKLDYATPVNSSYFFKTDVDKAYHNGKISLSQAPFTSVNDVYIPVTALTAAGLGTPAVSETVNDVSCVNIKNIPSAYSGYYASYDSSGLIAISNTVSCMLPAFSDSSKMEIMKKFLFDNISFNVSTFVNNGVFSSASMTSATHPYLFANQTKFDELKAVYTAGKSGEAGVDATLYSYLETRVKIADSVYKSYATLDASGDYSTINLKAGLASGQASLDKMPYQSGYGYDVGGRLSEAASNNDKILSLAYAYQVTKEDKYALLAYDYAIAMGKWEHWGPGHFLNCADASTPYATAYDWLYNAWVGLRKDVTAIETIIFTHSILPAYYSIHDNGCPWYNPVVSSGWNIRTRENNWNAVCSSGVTVASLALVGCTTSASGTMLDIVIDGTYNPEASYTGTNGTFTRVDESTFATSHDGMVDYQDYCEYIINQCLFNLPYYGLGQYMPDGSYIESNSYWAYGTNTLFLMCAALTSATGTDFGLLDCWGMDRTALFALNTMSSDGQSWNYHDSVSTYPQETSWFQFLGTSEGLNDIRYAAIRQYLLSEGLGTLSLYETLYYQELDADTVKSAIASLERYYYMDGIDGFVVRDSWERGGTYAGFMGETNNLGHGQIDSGSFVYYNNGTMWFGDLGTENYNALGFWNTYRYNYYRMSAEGNNTLIVTSDQTTLPYGQDLNGSGEITKTGSNEYGAWAVMDQTSVYGGLASTALRGLFMTNDRKTVVIQDQVTFSSAQSAAWIAHTKENVMLSVDGKTAYLSDGNSAIRVTLIDNTGSDLKFIVKDYSDYYLTATVEDDFSENNGGQPQHSNAGWRKLVVEFNDVTAINFAVAIEEVPFGAENADEFKVGYSYTDMNSWVAAAGTGSGESGSGEGETTAVGKVTVKTPHVDKPDTPVVDLDLWGEAVSVASFSLRASSSTKYDSVEYTAYSFTELVDYINAAPEDAVIEVTLYTSNTEPVSIDRPCTVNTNGHSFLATSENYIAQVSGNTIEYKTGSVTVSWVINGTTYTETYTGSVSASYKGTVPDSGLFEVDNGDGTYSYFTKNGWAITDGGEELNSTGMIVTTANNVFYQANRKFDGLFVTVDSKGTVTGYYQASDLFQNTAMGTSGYKISLTDSFFYDGSGDGTTLSVTNMSLYLNGYTLGYATTESSDHFFTTANGANNTFNIYGPGEMSSTSKVGNIIYAANGGVYAENVTFTAPRNISDIRKYVSVYKNCTFNITNNTEVFAINNRNGAETNSAMYPGLVLDGCTINLRSYSASSKVFQVWNNTTLKLIGGTTINAYANPTNLLELGSKETSTNSGMDFANACNNMKISLGEVYYPSGVNLVSSVTSDTSNTYDYTDKIYYTEGAMFAESPTVQLDTGCVSARQDNAIYPYVIAKKTNCATVVWKNGSTTLATEYWVGGSTPTASDAIRNMVTVASGKMLIFNTEAVTAGSTYNITTNVIDSFGLKVNMTLQGDFRLNFYVDKLDGIKFILDGEEITEPEVVVIGGVEYYKISKVGIAPNSAGAAVNLQVVYGGVTINRNISIIDYAEKVLGSETQTDEAKAMMINVVKYIDAAYVYAGNNVGETALEYRTVNSLYSKYESLATAAVVDRANANVSGVADAISNAQLNLTDDFNFRFNFKSTYTGSVSFSYTANGSTVTRTVNVTNGKLSDGNGYVDISRKAYDMMGEISIITAGGTAVYSVDNYYHAMANELGSLTYLLNAMCAYSETARLYKESVSN